MEILIYNLIFWTVLYVIGYSIEWGFQKMIDDYDEWEKLVDI